MRIRTPFLLFSLGISLAISPAWAADGDPELSPRITQSQIENDFSLYQIRRHGLRIFSTPFNLADGLGDGPIDPADATAPGGRPTFLNHGSLLRMNGLDSQTCLECHNYRSTTTRPFSFAVGGSGALGQAAFPGVIDPDLDDSDGRGYAQIAGRVINPPFMFGAGGIEAVGKEMTQELQALKTQALASPNLVVPLIAKGVNFGSISHDGVDFDISNVQGVEGDLVIRPFGRTGCCATVREFDVGAMQFHHGIQPVEVVGAGFDADGDGVVDEILEGELSAMHIFQATLQRPRQVFRRGQRFEQRAARELFEAIGCADCHVPRMLTDSRFLSLSSPEVSEDPSANVYFTINLRRRAPGFRRAGQGVAVPMYADLKLHDMGPTLAEENGNSFFTTARLWGVADSAPYLHDGRALTLSAAISQHGGEAQSQANAFDALTPTDRNALIAFLKTLKAPMRPNAGLLRRYRRPFFGGFRSVGVSAR
jgi:hypothetical protein